MALRVVLFLAAVSVLAGVLAYSQWVERPDVVSGVIEAYSVRVGSRLGGRVLEVVAAEGQVVQRSDVLLKLEPYDLAEREAAAAAELAAARAELARVESGFRTEEIAAAQARRDQLAAERDKLVAGPRPQEIAAARARVDAAEADLRHAEQTLARVTQTFARSASTREQVDQAQESHAAALAMVAVRKEELDLLESGTRKEDIRQIEAQLAAADAELALRTAGYRAEEIAAARAVRDGALANVAVIERQREELLVRAPCEGVVEAVDIRPGDLVSPNAPVLSVLDTSELWMRAFVPADRLDVTTGQEVAIFVDSFPNDTFRGEVTYVSHQSEFTPSNAQTPAERVKRVYRMKVTLREGNDRLRPGMTGEVRLRATDERRNQNHE